MSVMFTDSDGNSEGAVDRGGPTREFLTLLMQTLQNSKICEGSEDWKNLTCDSQALRDDDYFLAGRIIAVSLVHGGPSPNFFSQTLYDSLAYDPQQVTPSVKDICDRDIAEIILEMENVSTLEGLKDVAAKHCNLLHVAGCYRYLQNLQDRDVLVQDFMKWYVCGRTRNSLERYIYFVMHFTLLEVIKDVKNKELWAIGEITYRMWKMQSPTCH
ncbi:G2/M phase-specific E3 ubiquitin-protein ligase-like [Huso huso]|uniref:G2/M phase-specific E3 ubiquitin-protein ligase-like n=1 Tax=Huso huso TaxID=61971 RepID=A0ABR1A5W8_HUSHU